MLGQLNEADEEQIEVRLLKDRDYAEELDIVAEELIDQYADDEMPHAERKRLEQHFFRLPQRREQLQLAMILKRRRSRKSRNEKILRFYLPLAAAVLVTIGSGIAIWRALLRDSDVEQGLIALQTAFKNQRPFEARLSGFQYAPALQRGGLSALDYPSRDRAQRFLFSKTDTSAGATYARGMFYLAERQFDKAIDQLNIALNKEPENAKIHNDLGVALFERTKNRDPGEGQDLKVEDYNQSLYHFNKSLEVDGSFLEALFNRALLYESMLLPQRAEEDWRKYLEKDPKSAWADEARLRLEALERTSQSSSENVEQIFTRFHQAYQNGDDEGAWKTITLSSVRIGNIIVERLIDEYLNLVDQGRLSEAHDRHQMLTYIGDEKKKHAEDDYVSAIALVYQSPTHEQLGNLVTARRLMNLGQTQVASGQFSLALKSHTEAKQLYKTAGDIPEALLNEYWLAICKQQLMEKEESANLFRDLVETCGKKNYKWLAVRSLNALGYHEAYLSNFSKAVNYSYQAHLMAQEASETFGNLSALAALMQGYQYLGNRQRSLTYASQVLASGFSSIETKQRWMAYNEAAWALGSFGLVAAAVDYQRVAVQVSHELQDPSIESLSYIRLGALYGKSRNYADAFNQIQNAFKILENHAGKPFAQQMNAYAWLQLGNVYRQEGDFAKAVESFNSCIDLYSQLNLPAFTYQARKGKLLSYIALGDTAAASEERDATLNLYEKFRSNIVEETNKTSFFDLENDVFDVVVDFEYSRPGGEASAFEYAERSRARSLLALVDPDSSHDLRRQSVDELRALIPDQVQIIQYSVLERRILIWVLWRNGFYSKEIEINAGNLKEKISAYLDSIKRLDQEQTLNEAKDLYNILLRPVESVLDKNKTLYIVPDKILVRVPFVALVSPDSGRYAIEDYSFAMSPSTSIFLECTRAAVDKEKSNEKELLLAVGNPAFDREKFADLPYLPSSGREVDQIGDFYNHKQLLVWKQAVKETVLQEMSKADVIHFATHAITDERSPLRSKLLLAKERPPGGQSVTNNGVLEASEIYESSFPKARLVVLSACQTNSGPSFRGEGVMSMARPFLARGVPMVVASLWAVDSDATAKLMVDFHEYRRRHGYPSVEALRKAQLDMLRDPVKLYQQPYYWASFNLIGGYDKVETRKIEYVRTAH